MLLGLRFLLQEYLRKSNKNYLKIFKIFVRNSFKIFDIDKYSLFLVIIKTSNLSISFEI